MGDSGNREIRGTGRFEILGTLGDWGDSEVWEILEFERLGNSGKRRQEERKKNMKKEERGSRSRKDGGGKEEGRRKQRAGRR